MDSCQFLFFVEEYLILVENIFAKRKINLDLDFISNFVHLNIKN